MANAFDTVRDCLDTTAESLASDGLTFGKHDNATVGGKKNSPITAGEDETQENKQCGVIQNCTTNIKKTQRIDEAKFFFDTLFGSITGDYWSYLWTLENHQTISFKVTDEIERRKMAQRAIELADKGLTVFYGVNLVATKLRTNERAKNTTAAIQTAIICDIDIEGGTHKQGDGKIYAPDFDTAKSFLPFEPSIIVNSGYGLHAYYIWEEPVSVTDDNRKTANRRNVDFIKAIRARAGDYGKTADGVGDLARVLRVPGTFNYKLGIKDDAPLCRLVEANDVRFTPADLDERIADLLPKPQEPTTQPKINQPPRRCEPIDYDELDKPTEQERAIAMLPFIEISDGDHDRWVHVGMILKGNGNTLEDWERWSATQPNYTPDKHGYSCAEKWATFPETCEMTIATLHERAQEGGYSEKDFLRDWYNQHPRLNKRHTRADAVEHIATLSAMSQYDGRDEEIIAEIRKACEWRYSKDANGKLQRVAIKPTQSNLDLIFEHDPHLSGLVGYDQFQGVNVFLKRAPWHDTDRTGEQWHDTDGAELRVYLRKTYADLEHKQRIEDAVVHFAHRNAFNAVKNFLESLPQWDGTARAATLFAKFLHAEDSEYTRTVTMNFLLGAIARVYHPGCDFQTCLVLQGAQRIGKSKLVKMLGGKEGVNPTERNWHVALKDSVDDSHAVDALMKGWVIEIEEFSAARKAEVNALKSFISANDDTRRFSYDRYPSTRLRHCVFVVTCNDQQILRDQTGNARFIIIKCSQKKFDRVQGMTPEYIRQVWAEALHLYHELFKHDTAFDETKLQLPLQIQMQAESIAESFTQDDGLTTEITSFLDQKILPQVVWLLLSREERRKFFVDGNLRLFNAYKELEGRRKARGGRNLEADLDQLHNICAGNSGQTRTDGDAVFFYGSEYRQHICAAEIFTECFGQDKRKSMHRINEILSSIDGWTLGLKPLRKVDPQYNDQRNPYYRSKDNLPDDDTNSDTPNKTITKDNFAGETIAPNDIPF